MLVKFEVKYVFEFAVPLIGSKISFKLEVPEEKKFSIVRNNF